MADVVCNNEINSSSILSVKNLLLSITFLFLAFLLKLYFPIIVFQFSFTGLPMLWTSSWLTPPYLYFVVNFIILAIAASSRFHQRNQEVGLSPMKIQSKDSGGSNKLEFEYCASFDNIDVQAPVETKPKVEVTKTKKKQMEAKAKFQAEARDLELKIKKKSVEFKLEAMKNKYVEEEEEENKSKMESSAKQGEDGYAHAKSPVRMNTVEIPMDYSSDQKGLASHHLQLDELQNLQAGKEEENDTLDGTWKMIMESRRIQNGAGLQGAAPKKVDMFRKSNNLRSPRQR